MPDYPDFRMLWQSGAANMGREDQRGGMWERLGKPDVFPCKKPLS